MYFCSKSLWKSILNNQENTLKVFQFFEEIMSWECSKKVKIHKCLANKNALKQTKYSCYIFLVLIFKQRRECLTNFNWYYKVLLVSVFNFLRNHNLPFTVGLQACSWSFLFLAFSYFFTKFKKSSSSSMNWENNLFRVLSNFWKFNSIIGSGFTWSNSWQLELVLAQSMSWWDDDWLVLKQVENLYYLICIYQKKFHNGLNKVLQNYGSIKVNKYLMIYCKFIFQYSQWLFFF